MRTTESGTSKRCEDISRCYLKMIYLLRSRQSATDYEILKEIHKRYESAYLSYDKSSPSRATRNYVPVNIEEVASALHMDANIVFGRLYYHLAKKYAYHDADGENCSPLFVPEIDRDRHAINFPFLDAVLAKAEADLSRDKIAFVLSVVAIVISAISLIDGVLH